MIKILCTTQKEKTELIGASEYLASLVGSETAVKLVDFLVNLYKNPGDIEIMEDGLVIPRSRNAEPTKRFEKGINKLFEL